MKKGLFTPALLALTLTLGGCSAVNSMTTPPTTGENYGTRTVGMKVEDESIESKIESTMARTDARLSDARIGINSYNGIVLLFGQVPSQELKETAGEIARNVRRVRQVHNELVVAANLPLGQRMTDTWLETRVQAELATNESIDSSRIEVISENSTIYLMGIVTRQESQQIVNAISGIDGIQRIVKVFEYLD